MIIPDNVGERLLELAERMRQAKKDCLCSGFVVQYGECPHQKVVQEAKNEIATLVDGLRHEP